MNTQSSPSLSIITATYNSAKTVRNSIESVLSQTYNDYEINIIDGLSSDKTLSLIKDYNDPRIKIFSEKDNGIFDALNKGIKKSNGKIIGFLHSDDSFADKFILENIHNNFESNVHGVYGNLYYVSSNNSKKIIRNWISKPFKAASLKYGWMPPHPSLFLKKSVYEKHGNFNLKYKVSSDYDFIVRIFKDNNLSFKYIPHTITNMKLGGNSNRDLKNIIIKLKEDYKIIKKNEIGGINTLLLKNFSKISQFF